MQLGNLQASVLKVTHKVSQTWMPANILKRNSSAGAFLWILRNFKEQLFYRTTPVAASSNCWFQVNVVHIIWENLLLNSEAFSKKVLDIKELVFENFNVGNPKKCPKKTL